MYVKIKLIFSKGSMVVVLVFLVLFLFLRRILLQVSLNMNLVGLILVL